MMYMLIPGIIIIVVGIKKEEFLGSLALVFYLFSAGFLAFVGLETFNIIATITEDIGIYEVIPIHEDYHLKSSGGKYSFSYVKDGLIVELINIDEKSINFKSEEIEENKVFVSISSNKTMRRNVLTLSKNNPRVFEEKSYLILGEKE